MPRNYVRKTAGPAYSKEDLANAVRDVANHNKSFRDAQAYYNVPISVISQRLHGRMTPLDSTRRGRSTALTKHTEDKIADCLIARAELGYPCDQEELRNLVQQYVKDNNLQTPFADGRPGSDWYYSFMKRHPQLSLKKPEHLQKCRVDARKPEIIYDFFSKLEKVIEKLQLVDPELACFVFNADESGFRSDPSRIRAIGKKGKALSRVSGGSGRESTTVLACISADGAALPPMIVFKGVNLQARWISEKALPGTLYTVSSNGWMEEPQFFHWFQKGFIAHIQKIREEKNLPDQGALLIYDGHVSHMSLRIVEEAIKNNIMLIKLPSHLTDKLQPLDKCVFGPVKMCWEKKLIAHGKKQLGKGSGRLTKQQFTELLAEVWSESMKTENIISGFKSTGIFPVDSTKFPQSDFHPADLEEYNSTKNNISDSPVASIVAKELPHTETAPLSQHLNSGEVLPPGVTIHSEPDLLSQPFVAPSEDLELSTSAILESPVEGISQLPVEEIVSGASDKRVDAIERLFFKKQEKQVVPSEPQAAIKKSVPRLKTQAYGEVLTTEEVVMRLKEADEKKASKTKNTRSRMTNKSNVQEKNSRASTSASTSKKWGHNSKRKVIANENISKKRSKKEEVESLEESSSDDRNSSDSDASTYIEDDIQITPVRIPELNNGDFVLAKFKGGKRNTTFFKYVCVVENIVLDELRNEAEAEVMGLKTFDETNTNFIVVPSDVSYIKQEHLLGRLPFPTILMKGERIYYHFDNKVPVAEN